MKCLRVSPTSAERLFSKFDEALALWTGALFRCERASQPRWEPSHGPPTIRYHISGSIVQHSKSAPRSGEMGHKRTWPAAKSMSALPPIADIKADEIDVR